MTISEAAGEPAGCEGQSDDLWRFSCAFYAQPGVSEALLALQDRAGLDVNLILFALWRGACGLRRLSQAELMAAERSAGPVTAAIVLPLRALRRKLRSDRDADIQRLRERIKALEIAAERMVQRRLAHLAGAPASDTAPAARAAVAQANLELVLGPKMAGAVEATRIREALEAFLRG
ncbi:MAG: TIGR02444 family protein [Alphaproteobacteria bacterium]|nr:MAG: TIGR02444 family protein [Alphaproteobacteria bacterium]